MFPSTHTHTHTVQVPHQQWGVFGVRFRCVWLCPKCLIRNLPHPPVNTGPTLRCTALSSHCSGPTKRRQRTQRHLEHRHPGSIVTTLDCAAETANKQHTRTNKTSGHRHPQSSRVITKSNQSLQSIMALASHSMCPLPLIYFISPFINYSR